MKFIEFVNKKERDARKQLALIQKVLEKHDWEVESFVEKIGEPYIYVKAPKGVDLSFEGIRIYKIGNSFAYRVQNESETQPYGDAYPLDVEDMFQDLMSEKMDESKAGKSVMKAIHDEIGRFFKECARAEKKADANAIEKKDDPLGKVVIRSTGTDYANLVHSKT